jgi:hypothetical protein
LSGSRIRSPWGRLAMSGVPLRNEFRVLETGLVIPEGKVLYAVDSDDLYHLLLPYSVDTDIPQDKRSAGVHIVGRRLEEGGNSLQFLDVACRKRPLNEVFTHLADDMLAALSDDASQPLETCRRVLSHWRDLIERESLALLSREVLTGLYAELHHLRELLPRNVEYLDKWVGPLGARHDFANAEAALEIKSSTRRNGRFIEVHGIEQLEPPQGGSLFVAVARVDITDAGGESISTILEDIVQRGADPRDLHRKLFAVGYDPRDARQYDETKFLLRENRIYEVDESFPKIVSTSFIQDRMPPGVVGLVYTVDLSNEPPRPLGAEEVEQLYQRLAKVRA